MIIKLALEFFGWLLTFKLYFSSITMCDQIESIIKLTTPKAVAKPRHFAEQISLLAWEAI
jgi:hypothetical protein